MLEGERTRDHASLECFVMVIMSRGDGERLYGVDGYKIDIDTIISMFDSEHCSYLRGKPKVFIFQTCSDGRLSDFMICNFIFHAALVMLSRSHARFLLHFYEQ